MARERIILLLKGKNPEKSLIWFSKFIYGSDETNTKANSIF